MASGVPALLLLAMLAEYTPLSFRYQRLDWEHPPPVYRALAADPDDVAVLEWPQNIETSTTTSPSCR